MPEGAEVRVIVEWLRKQLIGRVCLDLNWNKSCRYAKDYSSPQHEKKQIRQELYRQGIEEFRGRMPATISTVLCRGKCIIIEFRDSNDELLYLTNNLAIVGYWTWEPTKHSNQWLKLLPESTSSASSTSSTSQSTEAEDEAEELFYYDDYRHQGLLDYYSNKEQLQKKLKKTGPDLLAYSIGTFDNELNPCYNKTDLIKLWLEAIKKQTPNKVIGIFCLDQERFSGVGNYVRAEALYRARISPFRKVCDLTRQETLNILHHLVNVLYEAYNKRGLTIQSYMDPEGVQGTFQKVVYNQKEDPLGNPVEKKKDSTGRTVHWVPALQK